MMKNSKGISKKLAVVSLLICVSLSLSSCVLPWSKLTFRTFAQSMQGNNMAIVERDRSGNETVIPAEWNSMGITAWKVAGSKDSTNSLSMQYLEFDTEENCTKFYESQASYFSSAAGAGGSRSGNGFCTTGKGFYYYISHVGKKLVMGTCQTQDLSSIYKAIKRMPQVTKIDESGALK
ncbi:MAG: hypothetical protein K5851_01555 [Lachnospiraceae bacterium]|nr:hypothetical protein [Lachnospiraceae bacterium]